jgi:hypothetical protein
VFKRVLHQENKTDFKTFLCTVSNWQTKLTSCIIGQKIVVCVHEFDDENMHPIEAHNSMHEGESEHFPSELFMNMARNDKTITPSILNMSLVSLSPDPTLQKMSLIDLSASPTLLILVLVNLGLAVSVEWT